MESGKIVVYVPSGAKINIENTQMDDPIVPYEKRRSKSAIEDFDKITGGKYGRRPNCNK
jgi:hypothetical protein